jgi:hypothetical protein
MRWKKREFDSGADLNIEVPRYQLILGDLDQVPLELQQVQASDGYVGRLAFAIEDDYAAYVDKLLRWERPSARRRQAGLAVLHRARRHRRHRRRSPRAGRAPASRSCAGARPPASTRRARSSSSATASRPRPTSCSRARGPDPSVLFTLSHGEGAPRGGWRSHEEQRRARAP